jgi:hypothetical protein
MGMAMKTSFGVTVGSLVASEVPDNQRLISACREEHIWTADPSVSLRPVLRRTALFKGGC